MGYAVWVLRLAVAAVFGLAAWGKLTDRAASERAVQEFGLPTWFVPTLGWLLPAVELMVAVAVVPSVSAVVACCAALALLAVFTAAVGVQLRRGRRPKCSCFGAASTMPIGGWTLVRNAGIAVLIGAALWGSWTHANVPAQLPAVHVVALAAVVVFGAVQFHQAATARALQRQLEELRASRVGVEGPPVGTPAPEFDLPVGTPAPEFDLPVGTPAPEFDLPGIDGTRATLSGLLKAGRPVALVFLHPRCGACQGLVEDFAQWRDSRNGTLTLMPIGSGDLTTNTTWARTHHLSEMLVQDGIEIAVRYGLRGVPSAVLIDTHGRIAAPSATGPSKIRELLTDPIPPPRATGHIHLTRHDNPPVRSTPRGQA